SGVVEERWGRRGVAGVIGERVRRGGGIAVDRDERDLRARQLRVERLQVRRLRIAVGAPGGEELEQDGLAAQVAEADGSAGRRAKGEVGRLRADREQALRQDFRGRRGPLL